MNPKHNMQAEYFETSWKMKLLMLKRRVTYIVRETIRKYRKKKEYERFLSEDEERIR